MHRIRGAQPPSLVGISKKYRKHRKFVSHVSSLNFVEDATSSRGRACCGWLWRMRLGAFAMPPSSRICGISSQILAGAMKSHFSSEMIG